MNTTTNRGFWDGIRLAMLIDGYNYSNPQLSPDARYLAYTKSTELGTMLFIYNIIEKIHLQLTSEHSLSTSTAYGGKTYCWSSDSRKLYFSVKGKLHSYTLSTALISKLNSNDFQFSPFEMDGNLVFSVEHKDHMSLGLLDTSSEKNWPIRLPLDESFLYDASINIDGTIALHSWSFPNMAWNGSKIELLQPMNDEYTKVKRITVVGQEPTSVSQPKWSPNGKYLSFLSEKSGWLNLWLSNSDGSDPHVLVNEEKEHAYSTVVTGGSNHAWIDDENIIFTRNDRGFFSLAMVNITTMQVKPLGLPEGYYTFLSTCNTGQFLSFVYSDHFNKDQIMLVDIFAVLEGKDVKTCVIIVCQSGVKLSDTAERDFVKPTIITFPTEDGEVAHGLLYAIPDENGSYKGAPIIINVHGGPIGMRRNDFNVNAQYFASRGYTYFEVNHRGSIGYGKEYREKLFYNWGIYDVDDSIDALNYLHDKGFGDKTKAAIMGGSAGGYTVLMALANKPGVFKCGINLFGVSDQFLLADETHYVEKHYSDTLVGVLPQDAKIYYERSPVNIAFNIVDPLLILQGIDDPVVPKNQSELIRDKVKGIVEAKFYEGEGHGFTKRETLIDMYTRIQKFLKSHILYNIE